MQHKLPFFLFFFLAFASLLTAQREATNAHPRLRTINPDRSMNSVRQMEADTIIPPIFFDECAETLFNPTAADGGYVAGTNDFGDTEKAQFFRFDAVDNYLIRGAVVYMGIYDDEVADQLISTKIYGLDPTTDGPGELLATSASLRVRDFATDTVLFLPTYLELPEPLAMSATDFFVSVDFTDIYEVPTGNVSLWTTDFGCGDGFNAWELWSDGVWHAFDEDISWDEDLEIYLGAVVEEDINTAVREPFNGLMVTTFPNPASDLLSFAFDLPQSSEVEVTLTDPSGKALVYRNFGQRNAGRQTLSLPLETGLPAGIYAYQIRTQNGLVSGRVIVSGL